MRRNRQNRKMSDFEFDAHLRARGGLSSSSQPKSRPSSVCAVRQRLVGVDAESSRFMVVVVYAQNPGQVTRERVGIKSGRVA